MNLGFCSFSSSSSGNCYFIKSEKTSILVDAGLSRAKIYQNIKLFEMSPRQIHHVVLTHEHTDHVRSASAIATMSIYSRFYATAGTIEGMADKRQGMKDDRFVVIEPEKSFLIEDIEVRPFRVSHDAKEPLAFTFAKEGKKIAILTDTGCITEDIMEAIKGADILVLESNHEVNILLYGSYPYSVKRRILSDEGHLSNEAAGRCLVQYLRDINGSKVPKVLLAHLSQKNNTPEQALLTVRNILEEADFYVGKDLSMDVVLKDTMTDFIYI